MGKNVALIVTLITVIMGAVVPASSQGQERVTQVFHIEHIEVEKLASILKVYGGTVKAQPDLGLIVWNGPPELLDAIESAVTALDVPQKAEETIELTAYLLTTTPGGTAQEPPEDLSSVVAQVKKLMHIEEIGLLETTTIRCRNRSGSRIISALTMGDGKQDLGYKLEFKYAEILGDEGERSVYLKRLELGVGSGRIDTDIDLPVGKMMVIGKTSTKPDATPVFLVLTASVS